METTKTIVTRVMSGQALSLPLCPTQASTTILSFAGTSAEASLEAKPKLNLFVLVGTITTKIVTSTRSGRLGETGHRVSSTMITTLQTLSEMRNPVTVARRL
jgi:hypothetical protein